MPDCHEAADRGGTLLARRGWSLAVSATLSGRAVVNIRMIISLACPTIHSSLKLRAAPPLHLPTAREAEELRLLERLCAAEDDGGGKMDLGVNWRSLKEDGAAASGGALNW